MPLPPYLANDLDILFVGINPGLESERVGHYYAGPGNLFWKCLHQSGLTPELLKPEDDHRLLEFKLGVTDCVSRASRTASEVRPSEFKAAAPGLIRLLEIYRPRIVSFNGLMGFKATIDPRASLGRQPELLANSVVFVTPSTSAANAGFTRTERLEWFQKLRRLRDEVRSQD